MFKRLAGNTFFHVLILLAVAVYTFLPTLEMFFYLDEWGNIYEWTHFPYVFTLFTSHILYLLFTQFGIDAIGYFAVGTSIYALSVIVFYAFVSKLLKNKLLGFVAGLLYATTPVGTSTVFMLWTFIAEGGYPLNVALLILLYIFLRYFRERKLFYYLFVLFGFLLFLELEPRRVFLFLPIIVIFDYLINFKRIIPSLGFLLRTATFFISFIAYYKYDVSLSKIFSTGRIILNESASPYDWRTKLELGISALTHVKPLVTLTNILLAGPWIFASEKLVGYVNLENIEQIYVIVFTTLSVALALVILTFNVKREWGLLLLFSLVWIYINIWGIYVFSSPGISDAAHRTLSLTAPAYALFITISGAALYTFLRKRIKNSFSGRFNTFFTLTLLIIIGTNFLSTRYNFERFNTLRSRPARAFFSDLKRFYPTLPSNSLIYIKTPPNAQIKHRLSRIYGGNNWGSGSTIAVFYPERTMEEINVVTDYRDVEKFVGSDPAKVNHVFAFYFDESGLSDTTVDTRSSLRK